MTDTSPGALVFAAVLFGIQLTALLFVGRCALIEWHATPRTAGWVLMVAAYAGGLAAWLPALVPVPGATMFVRTIILLTSTLYLLAAVVLSRHISALRQREAEARSLMAEQLKARGLGGDEPGSGQVVP